MFLLKKNRSHGILYYINSIPWQVSGGGVGRFVGGSATRRKLSVRNSEDLLSKMWTNIRSNNGIMVLLKLLTIKTPITEADSVRALACKVGLVYFSVLITKICLNSSRLDQKNVAVATGDNIVNKVNNQDLVSRVINGIRVYTLYIKYLHLTYHNIVWEYLFHAGKIKKCWYEYGYPSFLIGPSWNSQMWYRKTDNRETPSFQQRSTAK